MRLLVALADLSDGILWLARPTLLALTYAGSCALVVWLLWRWDRRETP